MTAQSFEATVATGNGHNAAQSGKRDTMNSNNAILETAIEAAIAVSSAYQHNAKDPDDKYVLTGIRIALTEARHVVHCNVDVKDARMVRASEALRAMKAYAGFLADAYLHPAMCCPEWRAFWIR